MTLQELTEEMKDCGKPAFRAKQIYDWLHVKLVRNYGEMKNLGRDMIEYLDEHYPLYAVKRLKHLPHRKTERRSSSLNCMMAIS